MLCAQPEQIVTVYARAFVIECVWFYWAMPWQALWQWCVCGPGTVKVHFITAQIMQSC
jgi:hypothetical protein